ncbi:CG15510 [Drosophila busckii]|uniref:CG15510 n=1 Tax=Drosophila busckii TaxID=30019 RepID=A0A0M5IZ23_DROBS|nr:protamine-like protein 99C [Drosophila busckii]ALC39698.1 CG15510 [Drosophila busckii]ALC39699.1 CG15510 [Drosophila busckii]
MDAKADVGPVVSKGFIKFMTKYGTQKYGVDVLDASLRGCRMWNNFSSKEQDEYRILDDIDIDDDVSDTCCPKKRKPACHKKPACRKKSACHRKKKPSCRRKPSCPMRRKPSCRPKKKSCRPKPRCGRKKIRCQHPGPITNNGYLNFLRVYRRKHCGLKPNDLVLKAARAWCRLPEHKKDRYRRQACKVTKNCRHKRRRVCTGKK